MMNRRLVFELLFQSVSGTLQTLARDPRRLGAQIGFTAVLHTWTRDLRFHPHLHCIVTGGGLSIDGHRWVPAQRKCLFPVKVLGRLFRGKLDAALTRVHDEGHLELPPALASPGAFMKLRKTLFAKDWVIYAKRTFAGAEQVYSYLGRYTHRVGISNHRILSIDEHSITIATRNGAKTTIPSQEFIRRFLHHILPKGFRKIRHYGLLASSNADTKLEIARQLLVPATMKAAEPDIGTSTDADWKTLYESLTGRSLRMCPACDTGHLRRRPLRQGSALSERSRPPP
jgi:hypothetical protein